MEDVPSDLTNVCTPSAPKMQEIHGWTLIHSSQLKSLFPPPRGRKDDYRREEMDQK